ncbi:hypothetical protein K8R04_02140 [Candidatus Uhrbacteria bacterium]|nr:hypothetical protein [Candidatus Uhrbacteria bacterium]
MPVYSEVSYYFLLTPIFGGLVFLILVFLASYPWKFRGKQLSSLKVNNFKSRWKVIVPAALLFGLFVGGLFEASYTYTKLEIYEDRIVFYGTEFFVPTQKVFLKAEIDTIGSGELLAGPLSPSGQRRGDGDDVLINGYKLRLHPLLGNIVFAFISRDVLVIKGTAFVPLVHRDATTKALRDWLASERR